MTSKIGSFMFNSFSTSFLVLGRPAKVFDCPFYLFTLSIKVIFEHYAYTVY